MQTQILKYKKIQKVITESGPSLPGLQCMVLCHLNPRCSIPMQTTKVASNPLPVPARLGVNGTPAPTALSLECGIFSLELQPVCDLTVDIMITGCQL